MTTKKYRTVRFLSFDCLNSGIEFFSKGSKKEDLIVLIEPWEYLTTVKHHKKKIILILSAMRRFLEQLKKEGWTVLYFDIKKEKKDNQDFTKKAFETISNHFNFDQVSLLTPNDFTIIKLWKSLLKNYNVPITWIENPLFLMTVNEFKQWATNRKELTMEYFYRLVRKKYNILFQDGKPTGGQWNFDKDNRESPPSSLPIIKPFKQDPHLIIQTLEPLIDNLFFNNYGSKKEFYFATCRDEALKALKYFILKHLKYFGSYQDIMVSDNPWLYHSHLSFYLNLGLLTPQECVLAALNAFEGGKAPLNSVEGFIRQIIGWREYMRGFYFYQGPNYENLNYLKAKKTLPKFFWDNRTSMNCLQQALSQTSKEAYAHHIQRLMIIGNFSLLAGLNPKEVNDWFGLVYADAYPWVHTPNVIGMSLFADQGLLATKPYCSSGSYINKMSNYCSKCKFNVKEKLGPIACPFNYLYWYFLFKHQKTFEHNQRMRMIYATGKRMSAEKKEAIIKQAEFFLEKL